MFEFKLTGAGSINKDYQHFNTQVHKATQAGARAFASELTPCLQKHIQTDVYLAYIPEFYQRRYDNPQYGQSIFDSKNMDYRFLNNGRGVEFTYTPNGKNRHYPNSDYWIDGDDIIDTIQQDRGYLWLKDGNIGKQRPFWNRFVQEVGAQGDEWFVKGFNSYDHDIQAQVDGNIQDKTSDYKIERTGEIFTKRFDD